MAEFVIGYSKETGKFGSTTIRAELVQRGRDVDIPLRIKELTVTPDDVIEVATDPSSTETVAVLRAKLFESVDRLLTGLVQPASERDTTVLQKVASPVTVSVTVVPIAEQTMTLISAAPVEVTQSCTVRVDVSQRIHECEELMARLERLIEKRLRMRDRLDNGIVALRKAYRNEEEMHRAYRELESEHTKALALLGAAAGLAALAFGAMAVAAGAYAMKLRAGMMLFGSIEKTAEYMVGYGMTQATEAQIVTAATTRLTHAYVTAAASATDVAVTAGTWESMRQKMSSGLTDAQTAMASAVRMRQALRQACEELKRELTELERDYGRIRERLRGCPDVELAPEPAYDAFIPDEDNWRTIRG
jgi:hypothetical protein